MSSINESSIHTLLKEREYSLLGQIDVSDEDYAALLRYLRVRVSHLYYQASPVPSLMVSLALVQIAIRHYKDGQFWPCFKQQLGVDVSSTKTNYLGQIFYQTIRHYGLFCPQQDSRETQYVECIKAHAFVTNYYMDGFFDFSDAFYENNLFREITDDIDEDLEDLSTFMKTTLSGKNDLIAADSDSRKAAKSYRLLKSTRTVFAQCDISTIRAMFVPILEMMDRYFYDNELPQVPGDRFGQGFTAWCGRKNAQEGSRKDRAAGVRQLSSHKPFIRVDTETESAHLVIPPQKFRNDDCVGQASVEITACGHSLRFGLELYRSFGIYISEELSIPIGDIFEAMDITVEALATKRYRLQGANYRIFNTNWEGIDKFSKGHNYLLVRHGISAEPEQPEDVIYNTDEYRKWRYYSLKINDSSVFYVGSRPLSVIGEFSSEPIFEKIIENMSVRDQHDRKLMAVRCHPTISFVVEKNRFAGTALVVNDQKYSIAAIRDKNCCDWPGDRKKVAVTMDLNTILPLQDGSWNLYVDVPGCSHQQRCQYVILRKVRFKFNKPRYTYDTEAILTITTDGYGLRIPDPDWQLVEESEKWATYTFSLDDPPQEVVFDLIADREYRIGIPLRIFRYGFSRHQMYSRKAEYIWHTDLGENLYVQIPGAVSAGVYPEKDESQTVAGTMLEPGLFRIDISEFRYQIQQNHTRPFHYLNIRYVDNIPRRVALPVIYRTVMIKPYFKLQMKDGVAYVDVNIEGRGNVFLTVNDKNRNTVIDHRPIHSGINYLQELESDEMYSFFPTMEEEDEFGLDVEVTNLKPLLNIGAVDRDNLVDCRLPVIGLTINGEEHPLSYDYFVDLRRKVNAYTYEGYMYGLKVDEHDQYIKGKDGRKVEVKLGRVRIYVDTTEEDRLQIALECFSWNEQEWMSPYYDTVARAVIHFDNELLDRCADHDRFIALVESSTVFTVNTEKVKKIKRMNINAV